MTVKEIAKIEGVDERQIYLSISHIETRLPRASVISNRNFRNALVAHRKLSEKYAKTLEDLMDGKGGTNWNQRCRALQHFRRTVGLENGGGVQVTTELNVRTDSHVESSYEERLARIRAAQDTRPSAKATPNQVQIGPGSGQILALLPTGGSESG